jgi:hypothetical protein
MTNGGVVDNRQASQLTTGAIIIVVGLLLLAGQLDRGWHFGRLWPVILIAMRRRTLPRDHARRAPRQRSSGCCSWAAFSCSTTFGFFTLQHSWPLFVVLGGLMLMMKDERQRSHARATRGRFSHDAARIWNQAGRE